VRDAVVVGVAKGAQRPAPRAGSGGGDAAFDGRLAATLETLGARRGRGRSDQAARAGRCEATVVLAVGLGDAARTARGTDTEALRKAAGVAAPRAVGGEEGRVRAARPRTPSRSSGRTGALLGAYAFTTYQAQAKNGAAKGPLGEIAVVGAKPRDKGHKAAASSAPPPWPPRSTGPAT